MENEIDKNEEYKFYLEEMNYALEYSYRTKNKIRLLLRLYVYMGLLLFIIGGLYFFLSFFEFNITFQQRLTLMISGVGLLLSLGAKFYIELAKEKEKELTSRKIELEKISKFILNWSTLERTLARIIESKDLSNNRFAIGKNLDILLKKGIISNRDFITLEKALDLRNHIVHGQVSITNEDISAYSEKISLITDKIIDKMYAD